MTAMIRNLATLTRLGIVAPMSEAASRVAARVNDIARAALPWSPSMTVQWNRFRRNAGYPIDTKIA